MTLHFLTLEFQIEAHFFLCLGESQSLCFPPGHPALPISFASCKLIMVIQHFVPMTASPLILSAMCRALRVVSLIPFLRHPHRRHRIIFYPDWNECRFGSSSASKIGGSSRRFRQRILALMACVNLRTERGDGTKR